MSLMATGQAKELLAEMNRSATQVVHQVNSRRGLSKKAAKEELNAARAIFTALTGEILTVEEWNEISG